MKFLICGLGSIGKRNLENLEKLKISCENILIFRTNKGTKDFGDKLLESHNHLHPVFINLKEALNQKPDVAFIMNPTSLHIPAALEAANAGCHLFITKPLSNSLNGMEDLKQKVKDNHLTAYVAYQLRFHPLLRQIKHWLDEKKIGKIISASAELSERVTDFHPWEDYRISYASRKDLGGGPVLSFSHEIDYLYWLFGKPKWVFGAGGKLSDLEIDVEDISVSIIQFPNVLVSLHLDYLKRPAKRFLEIIGEKGRIYWDYFGKKADLIPLEGEPITIEEPANYERNTMHIEELKHFLDCVNNKKEPSVGLDEGEDVLKICLAIKESMREQKVIYF